MRWRQQRGQDAADPARRGALRWIVTAALGVLGIGGCRPRERPPAPPVEVPLGDLVELARHGRERIVHDGHPVELRRTAQGVRARSLWCTHWGCEVRWNGGERRYLCPCHEGVFDENGSVVSGPPLGPLADYPVAVEGGVARIGGAV